MDNSQLSSKANMRLVYDKYKCLVLLSKSARKCKLLIIIYTNVFIYVSIYLWTTVLQIATPKPHFKRFTICLSDNADPLNREFFLYEPKINLNFQCLFENPRKSSHSVFWCPRHHCVISCKRANVFAIVSKFFF